MVGNCCKTSNFAVTCFAKEITRTANKGALGYIGCSDYSYWDEDFWWACGFKLFQPILNTMPSTLVLMMLPFMIMENLSINGLSPWADGGGWRHGSSGVQLRNEKLLLGSLLFDGRSIPQYLLFGAQPVTATYPANLPYGTHSLTVTTEPYAYVALSMRDSVLWMQNVPIPQVV